MDNRLKILVLFSKVCALVFQMVIVVFIMKDFSSDFVKVLLLVLGACWVFNTWDGKNNG